MFRAPPSSSQPTTSNYSTNLPLAFTPQAELLGSIIPLPSSVRVYYQKFLPTSHELAQCAQDVEHGRRRLVNQASDAILNTVLPRSLAESTESCLFAFIISEDESSPIEALKSLKLDGLSGCPVESFSLQELYPCSPECSTVRQPCEKCLQLSSAHNSPLKETLPRIPLRRAYAFFLDAVRDRLIDTIVSQSARTSGRVPLARMGEGFLLRPVYHNFQWTAGWEQHSTVKPMICCHLQVYLEQNRIIVHPIPFVTPFIPLPQSLQPGTPLILLPYSTPAYYLSTYSGSPSSLTEQFEASLTGLGAGFWRNADTHTDHSQTNDSSARPLYVIVWVAVQNTQGEEKGMTVIWPSSLCVTWHPHSTDLTQRPPLAYIPDLPHHLLPSPPQLAPPPPFSHAATPASVTETSSVLPPTPSILRRPPLRRSITSSPSHAFRSLTLSRAKPIRRLASDISTYVDAVAKEREREREKERERTRRERELAASPTLTHEDPVRQTANLLPEIHATPQAKITELSPLDIPRPSDASTTTTTSMQVLGEGDPSVSGASSTPMSISAPPVPPDDNLGKSESETTIPQDWDTAPGFMGIDYEMGFEVPATRNIPSISHGDFNFEDSFGTFTDDDFNFFDDPISTPRAPVAVPLRLASNSALPIAPLTTGLLPDAHNPLAFPSTPFDVSTSHVGGLPLVLPADPIQPAPWQLVADYVPLFPQVPAGPDLNIITPQDAPISRPFLSPTASLVKLDDRITLAPSSPHHRPYFEPIPFADSHRISDGKYAKGKFALPTPPDTEDRTHPVDFSSNLGRDGSWSRNYSAVTDPRVGVVRKLIGVKRKGLDDSPIQDRIPISTSPHSKEHEEWSYPTPSADDVEEERSDNESDEDEAMMDEADPQRSMTPGPSSIPPGPSLLAIQFLHPLLLAQSRPLRSESATLASSLAVHPVHSVPTPVSPAAIASLVTEKARSLEAAVQILVKEISENSLWAHEWNTTVAHGHERPALPSQSDVSFTQNALAMSLPQVHQAPTLQDLLERPSSVMEDENDQTRPQMQQMETPFFFVGKASTVITALPSSLRFWKKLGLSPRAGDKNVQAYACFEDRGDNADSVSSWLNDISAAYTANNYGNHSLGSYEGSAHPGIVPVHFDSFRKDLSTFLHSLPASRPSVVVYVVMPTSVGNLESPIFRQVLSTIKRADRFSNQVLFHLIPERLVLGTTEDRALGQEYMSKIVRNVYDRLLQTVLPSNARRFDEDTRTPTKFTAPAFTLSREKRPKVNFSRDLPLGFHDIIDRGILLHVGYSVSACGKWHTVACVDERGEGHEVGAWLAPSENPGEQLVSRVWTFAMQFARRVDVEWRIAITRLGSMSETELLAWKNHLQSIHESNKAAIGQVAIFAAEQNSSWIILGEDSDKASSSARLFSQKEPPRNWFMNTATMTYALIGRSPQPLRTLSSESTYRGPCHTHIPEQLESSPDDTLGLLPLSTTTLFSLPAGKDSASSSMLHLHLLHSTMEPGHLPQLHQDVARSFHDLSILATERLERDVDPFLPLHLSIVDLITGAIAVPLNDAS